MKKCVDTQSNFRYYSLCGQQLAGCKDVKLKHLRVKDNIAWLLGQAVKTPPFHGGNRGSIPLGVTILHFILWAHSSAGRAPALQAGGHRFEPCCAHHEMA